MMIFHRHVSLPEGQRLVSELLPEIVAELGPQQWFCINADWVPGTCGSSVWDGFLMPLMMSHGDTHGTNSRGIVL